MRYVRKPDGEMERVEAARLAFDAACTERGKLPREEQGTFNYDGRSERWQAAQDVVHAAYLARQDAETSYFRLNIFGMNDYASLMDTFGMLSGDHSDHPEWPDAEKPPYSLENDEWEQVEYPHYFEDQPPLEPGIRARAEAYVAANRAVRAWHGSESPVIPGHKFSSNDGWICTPEECLASVEAWKAACRESGAGDEELGRKVLIDAMDEHKMGGEYWLRWVAYIERAAEFGGFEVH